MCRRAPNSNVQTRVDVNKAEKVKVTREKMKREKKHTQPE